MVMDPYPNPNNNPPSHTHTHTILDLQLCLCFYKSIVLELKIANDCINLNELHRIDSLILFCTT